MKKILIVDDDITLITALTRYLETRGYLVNTATSGDEGFSLFEKDPPDLVVSDVVMQKMKDGMELCRRIRSTRTGQLTPILMLSSRDAIDDRIEGHQMGADDYLIKPFEPRELLAKIEAQLERSRRIHAEIIRIIQHPNDGYGNNQERPEPLPLTPAEEKVFWQVIQGLTNKQIGDQLFVSPRTVQTHLSNILSKLQLDNRSQLIRFAFEHGYRPPKKKEKEPAEEATGA